MSTKKSKFLVAFNISFWYLYIYNIYIIHYTSTYFNSFIDYLNMSEKFNLSWNDFQSNVLRSFSSLRRDTALCDVTLVTDDHKLVRAHKTVLSTCSDFFKTVFQNSLSNSNQLMLYLGDMSCHDLNIILDYIYLGEAHILQEGLEKFLENAQKLKLEGLLQTEDTLDDDKRSSKSQDNEVEEEKIVEHFSTEANRSEIPRKVSNQTQSSLLVSKMSFDGNMDLLELEQKIQEMTETDDDKLICRVCGKVTTGRNKKQDIGKHIETHIEGLSFDCQLCDRTFRSRNSLKTHTSMNHRLSNTK